VADDDPSSSLRELFVSTATVTSQISSLLAKTDGRTRVQAAVSAFRSSFARPEGG
jgi:DNA-binding NarL/FixJ family response regulator